MYIVITNGHLEVVVNWKPSHAYYRFIILPRCNHWCTIDRQLMIKCFPWQVHNVILQLRKVRKLLSTKQTRHSWGNSMMWFLNWMTYFTTRLAFHFCITMKLFHDASKFPQGFEWSMKFMGMLSLNVFNLNMGKNLWKIYRKERFCVRLQQ